MRGKLIAGGKYTVLATWVDHWTLPMDIGDQQQKKSARFEPKWPSYVNFSVFSGGGYQPEQRVNSRSKRFGAHWNLTMDIGDQ